MPTKLFLQNARVVDPQSGLDEVLDLIICHGRIVALGQDLKPKDPTESSSGAAPCEYYDLAGQVIMPGLFDMHVHLREPGYEYKGDIASESKAALKGGFTDILAMPNTSPACDNGEVVKFVIDKAAEVAPIRVHVCGALTKGEQGEALAEMGDMFASGACAFSDDGRGVQDAGQMRRAMDYARQFGCPVLSHCQDEGLAGVGQVNEGACSTLLGLAGWPAAAEEIQIGRDIALCRLTGEALHVQHVSSAHGLALVGAAKAEGLPVTCEVTPHHLFLCEEDIDKTYPTNLKVNPPLRTRADMEALQEALCSGQIDCIATDHAPHAQHEKQMEFELAPFGTTGLETALSLLYTELIEPGRLSWASLVNHYAVRPRQILGQAPLRIAEGEPANLTVFNPRPTWTVSRTDFVSKASNSAFLGRQLKGQVSQVFVDGQWRLRDGLPCA
ncbi:MAG: dihydroorotase [Coriobacteriales bacterium]|jgi:dihydroorotase|nr:dihydroorotase [Coriobacteriales bacterium]